MTIVVGYIPSKEGLAAVDAAVDEARLRGLPLLVVNTGGLGDYTDPARATSEDLATLGERLTAAGIEHEVRQPSSPRPPAEEILLAADEVGAQLIVIGLRKRSPLGKFITGSTAQTVLLDASCDVLAVKPLR